MVIAPFDCGTGHVLGDQHHVGFEQAGLHEPTASGRFTLAQGSQYGDRGEQASHDIIH